jgi:protein phosphatase 1G
MHRILRKALEETKGDYKDALRKAFLDVDNDLVNNGGLADVGKWRKEKPQNKSKMMQMMQQVMAIKKGENPDQEEDEDLDGIGCTANVCLVDHKAKKLFVSNAGDSRCIMGHGGKCLALSKDHKPDDPIEIARIEAAGSVIEQGRVDGGLNLTRALGDLRYKKKNLKAEDHPVTANPDVFEYDLPNDLDFIFMGCDGVWERKSNEEMCEWLYGMLKDKKTADLKAVCS